MIRPELISSGNDQKSIDISPPSIKAIPVDCHLIIPEHAYHVLTNNYYHKLTHSDMQQQFYLAVVKNTADCECEDCILSPLLLLCKRITIMPLPTSYILGHFLLIIDIHSLSLKGFT